MKNKKEYLSSNYRKTAGLFQKNLFIRRLKKIYYYIDAFLLLFVKKPKKQVNKKKKIAILYNIALGDGVIFRSSILHIRNIYPKDKYDLTLICQKGLNIIYKKDDIFDRIINIDFNVATINLLERIRCFKKVRDQYYDLLIDPVGIFEWTTNIFFSRAICALEKVGVLDVNLNNTCSMKYINKIYSNIINITKKNASLLEYYSLVLMELSNGKYKHDVGFEKIKTNKNKLYLPKKYFVVFPCASMSLKRWSLDNYAYLAKKIAAKTGMNLVVVGSKTDEDTLNEFKTKLEIEYIDLVNKTNLNDFIDVLTNASLVISNDTSAYHISLTQGTPVAIITGGYTYDRYVLYDFPRKDEFVRPCIVVNKMPCFNCYNWCHLLNSNNKNWPCLESITKEQAWIKIQKYIDELKIGG